MRGPVYPERVPVRVRVARWTEDIPLRPLTPLDKGLILILVPIWIAIIVLGARSVVDNSEALSARRVFLDELRPVRIKHCGMERFGAERDGGYLLCANLLAEVAAAYSYGIEGRDSWGCAVSKRYGVTVHQYDCFDTTQPSCPGGSFSFHPECIGKTREVRDGRDFDSLSGQIHKNGDDGANILVKMDVEGAEWDSLSSTPDAVLRNIDQLAIEFHLGGEERYLGVVRKLKKHFYIANLHFNNFSCTNEIDPFPAWAFEVLFVNKRISELDESGVAPTLPHILDTPNSPDFPDCQNPNP